MCRIPLTNIAATKVGPDADDVQTDISNRHDGGLDGGLCGGLDEKIISVISNDEHITITDISIQLSVPKRTIEREIKSLKEKGLLQRAGGKRFGRWVINNN